MVYLVFKGARSDFLVEQLAAYDAAVAGGTIKEFLDVVYARYARRFPIDLPLDEDPSPEFLASVDDEAAEPEHEGYMDDLSPEDLEAEMKKVFDRQMMIQKRRRQIATWLHYRHMKQHSVDPRSTDPSNPFTALLFSITGIHPSEKPRQKSAVNCWSKSQTLSINQLVRQWCISNNVGRKNSMAVWNRIAREEFSKLPHDKQRYWEQKAKDDHAKELEQWKVSRDAAISTKPEDRQRCIEGIVRLGQEFLDRLAEATGWKWSLIGGGPEPISEGRLSVISLHGGTTNGEAPLNFGQKERELYLSQVLPVFSKFLRGCYTPEECRSRALTAVDAIPLEDSGLEELGITFDLACPPEVSAVDASPSTSHVASIPPLVANQPVAPPPSSIATPTASADPNGTVQDQEPARGRRHQSRTPSPPHSVIPSPSGSPIRSPSRRGRSISPPVSPAATNAPPSVPVAESVVTTVDGTSVPATSSIDPQVRTGNEAPSLVPNTIIGGTSNVASSLVPNPGVVGLSSVSVASLSTEDTGSTTTAAADGDSESASATRTSGRKRQAPAPRDAPLSKRGRTSLSVTPAQSAQDLSDSLWFKKALRMLEIDSLGEGWTNLVQAWIRFEASNSHVPGSLPAKGRPSAVGNWIQRARNPDYRPVVNDSKSYGDQHVAWWASLQPEWRVRDGSELMLNDSDLASESAAIDDHELPQRNAGLIRDNAGFIAGLLRDEIGLICHEDGDLEDLRQPGVNGLLSVLASLYFWGMAVKDSGKKSKRWAQSVEDCTYVLRGLSMPA